MKLNVPDMSCGHCKSAVEKSIHALDAAAEVIVDLNAKTVALPDTLDLSAVLAALDTAGYPASVAA